MNDWLNSIKLKVFIHFNKKGVEVKFKENVENDCIICNIYINGKFKCAVNSKWENWNISEDYHNRIIFMLENK